MSDLYSAVLEYFLLYSDLSDSSSLRTSIFAQFLSEKYCIVIQEIKSTWRSKSREVVQCLWARKPGIFLRSCCQGVVLTFNNRTITILHINHYNQRNPNPSLIRTSLSLFLPLSLEVYCFSNRCVYIKNLPNDAKAISWQWLHWIYWSKQWSSPAFNKITWWG